MTAKRPGLQWSEGPAGPVLAALDSAGPATTWQDYAACLETDPEIFFPEKGGSTRDAKKVCAHCFVQESCLNYALGRNERYGIYGGKSERERRKLQQLKAAS